MLVLNEVYLINQFRDFFSDIFSTRWWPARWHCGKWTDFHGWLYITAELMIWAAYFAIPLLLFRLITQRTDLPFPKIFWLFIAFILLCGSTHLMDAIIFWWPAYRFAALLKFVTGVVSLFTVYALYRVLPLVLNIRTVAQLEAEIEQRKRVEEELRIQHQELQKTKELLQMKDEFITLASHELKTPLTSLKGYLQIVATLPCTPDASKHRNFISKAAVQMEKVNSLVNQLFQSSKISSGQIPMEISQFNLMQVLIEAKEAFEVGGATDITLDGPMELVLEADKEKIGQVVNNLLDNALKYSPLVKKVALNVEMTNQEAKVYVKDFGIGIPDEKLNHLFDRYYRVENTSQNFSGMGLGLYITSEIVRKHGGTIGVESTFGRGSTFWFTLPLTQKAFRKEENVSMNREE